MMNYVENLNYDDLANMVEDMRDQGVILWVEGDTLKYQAPKTICRAKLVRLLNQYKQAIIWWLYHDPLHPEGLPNTEEAFTQNYIAYQYRWINYVLADNRLDLRADDTTSRYHGQYTSKYTSHTHASQ